MPTTIEAVRAALTDRYVVEREVGRGGMAAVYLARDLRHDRLVAVKAIARDVVGGVNVGRFLREIGIAARLTHPHVLSIHDSGEAPGLLYYVMPYVEGETLRARLSREGLLPLSDGLRLLRELVDAVAYAHRQGVMHRDLKPENVLLSGGHAVVADFGIAKAVVSATGDGPMGGASVTTLTAAGLSLGTPAYMAPEQILGDANVDHRADLYALGVIAYEVLTGRHPFEARAAQAMVTAHLTEKPQAVDARNPAVPRGVAAVVEGLLAKDPDERVQSAEQVLHALAGEPIANARTRSVSTRARWMRVAAVGGLAMAASAGLYIAFASRSQDRAVERTAGNSSGAAESDSTIGSIAVLPFVNTGGSPEDEYFSDGLTDELAHALARIPGLRLAGRTSSYAFKGRSESAQHLGQALEVEAFVTGSMRRSGDRIRVTAQLVSAADGKVLRDAFAESRSGDVFAVQDEITRHVVTALAPALVTRASTIAGAERGTEDQQAYELYLRGRYYWLERGAANVKRAVDYFQQAIARDPGFGRAYAGLAQAYLVHTVYIEDNQDSLLTLAERAALAALSLDSTLVDAQISLAVRMESTWRFQEAEARYQAATRVEPWNATVHHWYGGLLLSLGRTDEGVATLRRAVQLDPLAKSIGSALAGGLSFARRFDAAAEEARRVLAIDSLFPLALETLARASVFAGDAAEAVRTLEQASRLNVYIPYRRSALIFAYAAAGRWGDAARVRDEIRGRPDSPEQRMESAFADLVFGDREPMIRLLTPEPRLNVYPIGNGFGCNPFLDPLWSDPRFVAAMRRLSVQPCTLTQPWPFVPPAASARP